MEPQVQTVWLCRLRLKCDRTCAETRFRLSAKRSSPLKSAGVSVQSTTGSRTVRISGSNAGYAMFRGSVKGTGYPLHSPSFPFTSPPMRHVVRSHFNWNLQVGIVCLHVVELILFSATAYNKYTVLFGPSRTLVKGQGSPELISDYGAQRARL